LVFIKCVTTGMDLVGTVMPYALEGTAGLADSNGSQCTVSE